MLDFREFDNASPKVPDRLVPQNTFVRSLLISKKHYMVIQVDGKIIIKGMEAKKRDRPRFFNQVFSQLIDDYNDNKRNLIFNALKVFKHLEAAEKLEDQIFPAIIEEDNNNDCNAVWRYLY